MRTPLSPVSPSIAAILLLASCAGGDVGIADRKDPKVSLQSLPLNEELSSLPFEQERVLKKANTYQYDLASLVGHALFIRKDNSGNCAGAVGDSYDAIFISPESYLKADTKLEPNTVNNVIYDHKVDSGASTAFNVFTFASSLSKDKLAQVVVTDAAFLDAPNGSLATDYLARIRQVISQTGCPAILLLGAKVRVATYRYYNKDAASGSIGGAVFSANANVYKEEAVSRNEVAVTITPSLITGAAGDTGRRLLPNDSSVIQRVLTLKDAARFRKLTPGILQSIRKPTPRAP